MKRIARSLIVAVILFSVLGFVPIQLVSAQGNVSCVTLSANSWISVSDNTPWKLDQGAYYGGSPQIAHSTSEALVIHLDSPSYPDAAQIVSIRAVLRAHITNYPIITTGKFIQFTMDAFWEGGTQVTSAYLIGYSDEWTSIEFSPSSSANRIFISTQLGNTIFPTNYGEVEAQFQITEMCYSGNVPTPVGATLVPSQTLPPINTPTYHPSRTLTSTVAPSVTVTPSLTYTAGGPTVTPFTPTVRGTQIWSTLVPPPTADDTCWDITQPCNTLPPIIFPTVFFPTPAPPTLLNTLTPISTSTINATIQATTGIEDVRTRIVEIRDLATWISDDACLGLREFPPTVTPGGPTLTPGYNLCAIVYDLNGTPVNVVTNAYQSGKQIGDMFATLKMILGGDIGPAGGIVLMIVSLIGYNLTLRGLIVLWPIIVKALEIISTVVQAIFTVIKTILPF